MVELAANRTLPKSLFWKYVLLWPLILVFLVSTRYKQSLKDVSIFSAVIWNFKQGNILGLKVNGLWTVCFNPVAITKGQDPVTIMEMYYLMFWRLRLRTRCRAVGFWWECPQGWSLCRGGGEEERTQAPWCLSSWGHWGPGGPFLQELSSVSDLQRPRPSVPSLGGSGLQPGMSGGTVEPIVHHSWKRK